MLTRRPLHRGTAIPLAVLLLSSALVGVPAHAQECEAKVGFAGPLSGSGAPWGLASKGGADLIAALINEEGGLAMGGRKCRVRIVSYDSQFTPAGGAAASNYLFSQNVHIVLGPVASPEVSGIRPAAKRNKQLVFHSAYLSNALTPEYPLEFHALQTPAAWGALLVREAVKQFKFKTVVVVAANDQGGTDGSRQLLKQYAAAGVKGAEEFYQRGTINFAPIVARVMNANPEAVDTATMPPQDAAIFVKGLKEAGFSGALGTLGGNGPTVTIDAAGGVSNLKAFYWVEISPLEHPGVIKMKADYERVMKSAPPVNPLFPVYVNAADVLLRAISAAGTDQDPEKVAEALRKGIPESRYLGKAGWRGKAMYGINQELSFPIGLGMVVDGKRLPVRTVPIPAE